MHVRVRPADEVQRSLMPCVPETGAIDKVDQEAARDMLKLLMCYSSPTVLWAVTGSSMMTFWSQVSSR